MKITDKISVALSLFLGLATLSTSISACATEICATNVTITGIRSGDSKYYDTYLMIQYLDSGNIKHWIGYGATREKFGIDTIKGQSMLSLATTSLVTGRPVTISNAIEKCNINNGFDLLEIN